MICQCEAETGSSGCLDSSMRKGVELEIELKHLQVGNDSLLSCGVNGGDMLITWACWCRLSNG